jgi:hypothetical protein
MPDYAEIGGVLFRAFPANAGQLKAFYPHDGMTNAVMTIEYEHHEIHGGSMFRAGENASLENNGTRSILIVTPDTTKWAHLQYSLSSTLEVEFEFYEDGNITGGTAVTTYNRNRNSSTVSGVLVYHTPTITTTGTLLAQRREGAGKSAGTQTLGVAEWILKQNAKYLFRVTSRAGAGTTNYINWWIVWYEHTSVIT